jgi:ribosomal protein S18 acetylase RimI-like enzyme
LSRSRPRAATSQILQSLPGFWGERDVRHLHHPTAIEQFGDSAFVIHDQDGEVAAYLFGTIVTAKRQGYVHAVAVRQDHRGRGHARRLYGAFAELATAQGCTTLNAITTPTNQDSISFHRSIGMSAEEVPDYSGPGQPRMVLSRELAPSSLATVGERPIPGVVLRGAAAADVDAILAFWQLAAEDTDRPADHHQAAAALILRDPDAILLALLDKRIVGCVIASWDGWRAHLYRLAVHPDHRRKGLAQWLLNAAEQRLKQLGAIRIDAMVLDTNEHGHALWAASGYTAQPNWSRWIKPTS